MTKTCDHLQDGRCAVGHVKAKPSPGVCANCAHNTTGGEWPVVIITATISGRARTNTAESELLAFRRSPSKLLGDRLAAWFERWGADKAAAAWERVTGTKCGCEGRKDFINRADSFVRRLLGRPEPS